MLGWRGRLALVAILVLAVVTGTRAQTAPTAPGEIDVFVAGAASGRIDILLHFLNRGIDPDAPGRNGTTALAAAVRTGAESAVRFLLARDADPDQGNAEQWTPLMEACFRGRGAIVGHLLEAGAAVDLVEKRDGKTALIVAADGNDVGIVARLLDAGATIDASDSSGRSALMHAVASDKEQSAGIAAELIIRGADVNLADGEGRTPLMLAAASGNVKLTGLVLDAGGDPAARSAEGATALGLAARYGLAPVVRYLLGRDVRVDPATGLAPVAEAAVSGNREIVTMLLDAGAAIDGAGLSGKTALMIAAGDGAGELADVLIARGADVNAVNPADGTTALMWASNGGWMSVVRRLLDAGARASVVAKDGWTAAQAARMAGHDDIARLLEEGI